MFRWARRDRRIALILLADVLLAAIVISLALALWLPPPRPVVSSPQNLPALVIPTPDVGYDAVSPTPLPPTLNPTRLADLPNQGQTSLPTPPVTVTPRR